MNEAVLKEQILARRNAEPKLLDHVQMDQYTGYDGFGWSCRKDLQQNTVQLPMLTPLIVLLLLLLLLV